MARNVEIKAKARDYGSIKERAEALAGSTPLVMVQEDTFFNTRNGRLKIRQLAQDDGELIYYQRADAAVPKTSTYSISHTHAPAQLRAVLASALGERMTVRKTREVYLAGRTRIHLDRVEGLGAFMELEVVLEDGEDESVGHATALDMMARLGVDASDLIDGAYADLLAESKQSSR